MKHVRVLMVCDSQTGNVEGIARAVADGAKEVGPIVTASRVNDIRIDGIPTYDGLAFGSPTHCGTMTTKMNGFFNHRMIKHWGNRE